MNQLTTIFAVCGLALTLNTAVAAETTPKSKATGPTTSESDREFMKKAAQGGMTEVKLGELAKEKASAAEVKNFGAMMVTDHSKANEELKALAKTKGVELPNDLGKHQATVDKMAKLSGAEFDKAYVADMVKDHKADISEFEKADKSSKDPELKGFIEKTLPTLKTHLETIEKVRKDLKK